MQKSPESIPSKYELLSEVSDINAWCDRSIDNLLDHRSAIGKEKIDKLIEKVYLTKVKIQELYKNVEESKG